jgi:hypothetical protein
MQPAAFSSQTWVPLRFQRWMESDVSEDNPLPNVDGIVPRRPTL